MTTLHRILSIAIVFGFLAGCSRATPTAQPILTPTTLLKATQEQALPTQAAPTQAAQATAGPTEVALTEAARAFINQLVDNDFTGAYSRFDTAMSKAMPVNNLISTWHQVVTQVGPYKGQVATRTADQQGSLVVTVTCQFEDGIIDIQLVFDNSGKISGLNFTSVKAPATAPTQTAAANQPAVDDSLIKAAKTFVDQLVKGDYEGATATFDTSMKSAAPASKLKEIWETLLIQAGAFQQQTGTHTAVQQGYQIVFVTCQFEKTLLDVKVVFNSQGQISGLFFTPATGTEPTPSAYTPPAYVKPATYHEVEVTVGSGEWALPGTLTLPNGNGPFPAVVLVHGSGPNDRDESIGPNKPFRDLAWGLASQGVAVLRYDKRTKAHASQFTPEIVAKLTTKDEVTDDALLAVQLLRQTKDIDSSRIYVLGHSLGAMMAPRIGQQDPNLAGLIIMAGPTRPLEDVIVDQMTYLYNLDGTLTGDRVRRLEDH